MFSTTEGHHFGSDAAPASILEVPRHCGLAHDEERELVALIANGDQKARNRMVLANRGLVVTIARGFQGRGLVLDDLVGEGNLGLIRAAEKFDPEFGTRFSTYASYLVQHAIRDALMNRTATIRLPAHMVRLLTKWRKAQRRLCRDGDHMPDFDKVASILGLSEAQKSLVALAHHAGQLELESSYSDEFGVRLSNEATDRNGPIEERFEVDEEREVAFRRMERLDAREQAILSLRYGLDGEILTRREIGRRLGLSSEWVRKLEGRGLRKLAEDHCEEADGYGGRGRPRGSRGTRAPVPSIKPADRSSFGCDNLS